MDRLTFFREAPCDRNLSHADIHFLCNTLDTENIICERQPESMKKPEILTVLGSPALIQRQRTS
jgi:hypothetical protein